jgi:hypothetical protein
MPKHAVPPEEDIFIERRHKGRKGTMIRQKNPAFVLNPTKNFIYKGFLFFIFSTGHTLFVFLLG